MQKLAVFTLLASLSFSSHANDISYGVGIGGPYAGAIGFQVAMSSEDKQHKYYAALGLPGVSLGTQSVLENKHYSWGINVGVFDGIFGGHTKYIGPTFNYHVDGFNEDGWQIGTAIYILRETNHTTLFSNTVEEDDNHVTLGIQLGYHF
jgi:hypothetical protein